MKNNNNTAILFGVILILSGCAIVNVTIGTNEKLSRYHDATAVNEDAIASDQEAIRIKPDFANAYLNLGLAYKKSDRYDEAIASYKKSILVNPDSALAHNNLGVVYQKLGRQQEAIAEYKEALRINPGLAMARKNLNRLYKKTG